MKKYFILTMMSLLGACGLLTSCYSDGSRSKMLSGEWAGDFGMYYLYDYRGHTYEFRSFDTDIEFIPSYYYSSHGHGYQVDWYREGPYEYMSYHFEWKMQNGYIDLHYPADPNLDVRISNYRLSSTMFSGRFEFSGTPFYLHKLVSYDWSRYEGYDHLYGDRHDWWNYYAPARDIRAMKVDGTLGAETDDKGVIVKRGNRLAEQPNE